MTTTTTLEADLEAVRTLLEGITTLCPGGKNPVRDGGSHGPNCYCEGKGIQEGYVVMTLDPRYDPLRRVINWNVGYPTALRISWESTPPGALSGAVGFLENKVMGSLRQNYSRTWTKVWQSADDFNDHATIRALRKALEQMKHG